MKNILSTIAVTGFIINSFILYVIVPRQIADAYKPKAAQSVSRPIYIVTKPIRFYTTSSNINFNADGCFHGIFSDTNESILHINDGEDK